MFNERNNVRFLTRGKARLEGISTNEALLNDLSLGGCCLEFTEPVNVDDTVIYKLEIIPEPEAEIPEFTVSAEARWIRPAPWSCSIGFLFTASPKGKQVQRYMEYLDSVIKTQPPPEK